MIKNFLLTMSLVCIGLVFLGINDVHAQDPTETPTLTPTVTQQFSGGLIESTKVYSTAQVESYFCPDTLPTFWLTKTPSFRWLNECSSCWLPTLPRLPTITGTITPTWDPAVPTYTPTLTPIGSIPTQEPGLFVIKMGTVDIPEGEEQTSVVTSHEYETTGFNLYDHANKEITVGYIVKISGSIRNSQYAVERIGVKVVSKENYPIKVIVREVNGQSVYVENIIQARGEFFYPSWEWTGSSSPNPLTFPDQIIKLDVISGDDPNITSEYYVGLRSDHYSSDSNSKTVKKTWINGSVETLSLPTPTITPTPINSYCSEVESNEIAEDLFGFSGLIFGDANCFDLGGYYFDILGVKMDIPQFAHICFQSVNFGRLSAFGLSISMDLIIILIFSIWGVAIFLHA